MWQFSKQFYAKPILTGHFQNDYQHHINFKTEILKAVYMAFVRILPSFYPCFQLFGQLHDS